MPKLKTPDSSYAIHSWWKQPLLRAASIAAALTVVGASLSGCNEAIENAGTDNDFIRTSNLSAPRTIRGDINNFLPTSAAGSASYQTLTRKIQAVGASITTSRPEEYLDRITYIGQRPLAGGGGSGHAFEIRRGDAGKVVRTEIFQIKPAIISVSRVQGEQNIDAIPPIPLISSPIQEGAIKEWSGNLILDGVSYPGTGYTRIRNSEELELPQGKIRAFRTDCVLKAATPRGEIVTATIRWFVPGKGIVQMRTLSNNLQIQRQMNIKS